jgi:hypothetical protein
MPVGVSSTASFASSSAMKNTSMIHCDLDEDRLFASADAVGKRYQNRYQILEGVVKYLVFEGVFAG